MRLLTAALVLVAACDPSPSVPTPDAEPEPQVCHFESGRECRPDTVCLGIQGGECNYALCVDGKIQTNAAGCAFADVPPREGGPFDCDPTLVVRRPGVYTPPLPCPLGSLNIVRDNRVTSLCVPLAQCRPIACDPAFRGDGCPILHDCDPASRTCVRQAVEVCHFPSGRPCRSDTVCLADQGVECNYIYCDEGHLRSTAIGCGFGEVPPLEGGPFDCDPSVIVRRPGPLLPPNGYCPLGSLRRIENNGLYSHDCVPLAQCKPIPCDPAYRGDGCPSTYTCDPTSSTCVPAG